MKYLILATVCFACIGCAHESVPVNAPISKPVVTVRQLPPTVTVGECVTAVTDTWYSDANAYANQKSEEYKQKYEENMAKLRAAIEEAVNAKVCICKQGDPLCSCM